MKNLNYILAALVFVLFTSLLITCNNTSIERKETKKLAKEYKELEKQKKELGKQLAQFQTKYAALEKKDSALQRSIGLIQVNNSKLKKDLSKAKSELAAYRKVNPVTPGDSLCDQVIAECDTLISGISLVLVAKDSLIIVKNSKINNLQKQLINRELAFAMSNDQLALQTGIIDNQKLQIRKLKTNNIVLGTTGGAIALGLILGLVLIK